MELKIYFFKWKTVRQFINIYGRFEPMRWQINKVSLQDSRPDYTNLFLRFSLFLSEMSFSNIQRSESKWTINIGICVVNDWRYLWIKMKWGEFYWIQNVFETYKIKSVQVKMVIIISVVYTIMWIIFSSDDFIEILL